MLGKVLKYDIKAIGRYLIPLYAVLLGLGIMIRILDFFEKVSVINIILGFMIAAFILLITFSFAPIERGNFNLLQFYWLLNPIESTSTN